MKTQENDLYPDTVQTDPATAHETDDAVHPLAPPQEPREVLEKRLNDAYLDTWRTFVLEHCTAYVRRYPDRCARPTDTSWRPVEIRQLARARADDDFYFSQTQFPEYQTYFDDQEIPPLVDLVGDLAQTARRLEEQYKDAKVQGIDLVVERIRTTFALSKRELLLLMSVALASMDPNVYRAMALAWGNVEVQKVRVDFLCDMCSFDRRSSQLNQELLSDRGQLIRMRLLIPERDFSATGLQTRMFSYMGIDQRVIDALRNADLSANLPAHTQLIERPLRPKALMVPKDFSHQFKSLIGQPRMRILLTGPRHGGRCTTAASYAQSVLKKRVVIVDVVQELERIAEHDLETHFCDMLRECLLLNGVLLMRFDGLEDNPRLEKLLENFVAPLSKHIEHFPGTIVLTAKQNMAILTKLFSNLVECHLPLPTPKLQEQVWTAALTGIFDDNDLKRLSSSYANNYQLTVGQILTSVHRCLDAHANHGANPEEAHIASHHILEEIRKCFNHDLGTLADVILSDIPISRVILPEPTARMINEILDFARFQRTVLDDWGYRACSAYGNSLSILFSGPPGTGKTLLATAMANELGKILYRVDLSRIVDKYVGETEKNLSKIFDEAAKAQAILLFDEADSLFAKRTDVKSSNDRYANLEVNFLIQKLESYQGISILTTNLQSSIDEAFKRRLRYIVEFRDPDVNERIQLWKNLIAPKTPLKDDINWRILSENFELSGGHIRNATLNASIRAAAKGEALGMQYLLEAAIDETKKLGKLVKLSDKVLLILDSYGVDVMGES